MRMLVRLLPLRRRSILIALAGLAVRSGKGSGVVRRALLVIVIIEWNGWTGYSSGGIRGKY
jgi:hypothetical protein